MKAIPNKLFFDYVAERLSTGDNVRLRLKGNSMFPLLRNNRDIVVLAPCACEALAPMDVVLFRYRGDYVLHRIVRRNGDSLLMQGDGVYASYEQCTVGDVVGRVVAVCRQSGRVDDVDGCFRVHGDTKVSGQSISRTARDDAECRVSVYQ